MEYMATQISSVKFGTTDITKVNINNTWYFWPGHTTDITHSGGFAVNGRKEGVYVLKCWVDSHWGEQSDVNLTWHGHNTNGTIASNPAHTHYNWIKWYVTFKIAGVTYDAGDDWMVRDYQTDIPKRVNIRRDWVETISTPIKNLYMD